MTKLVTSSAATVPVRIWVTLRCAMIDFVTIAAASYISIVGSLGLLFYEKRHLRKIVSQLVDFLAIRSTRLSDLSKITGLGISLLFNTKRSYFELFTTFPPSFRELETA